MLSNISNVCFVSNGCMSVVLVKSIMVVMSVIVKLVMVVMSVII